MPRGSRSDPNGSKAKPLIPMAITGFQTTSNTDACWTTTSPSRDGNAAAAGNKSVSIIKYQEMSQAILRDFERAVEVHRDVKSSLEL